MTIPTGIESHRRRDFADPAALAAALADAIAGALAMGIKARGAASLLVSGGSTPKRFLSELAGRDLDWDGVTISLVDERWVPPTSERSNAALVTACLAGSPAANASFVPLFVPGRSATDGVFEASKAVSVLPRPFDAVVLGMGNDGHTASFFPGADRLAEALDPAGAAPLIAIEAPGAGEPRVTFTLRELLNTGFLALHIEGAEKAATLARALGEGPVTDMPVRAVLRQTSTPVNLFWCP